MKLVHSTFRLESAKRILQEGIKAPKETGIREHDFPKNSDVVCFTALEKKRIEYNIYGCWGDYHFILNDEWFMKNLEQFREHRDEVNSRGFEEFFRQTEIKPYGIRKFPTGYNQVLSLKPVPVEGLGKLIVPSSELVFFDGIAIPENIQLTTYQKVA